MNDATFHDLFGLGPIDRAWQERRERLWAMSADDRVAAMRAGELSYRELCEWSAGAPSEVPLVCTGQGGAGEFEWLAMLEPGNAEHDEDASRQRRQQHHYTDEQTAQRRAAGRAAHRAS
jgi:hypothetical protein